MHSLIYAAGMAMRLFRFRRPVNKLYRLIEFDQADCIATPGRASSMDGKPVRGLGRRVVALCPPYFKERHREQ